MLSSLVNTAPSQAMNEIAAPDFGEFIPLAWSLNLLGDMR